jgi:hypothetical protein
MAHRRSHRSRRSHRRSRRHSRRSHRRHQQHGGSSCAALPMNREAFGQRGGMAPFGAGGPDYLMDGAARVQAEVGPLDAAFAELSGVIPHQGGGRRRSRRHRSRRHWSRRHRRQQQRGGMYAFNGPSMLLDSAAYAKDGTNPQFHTEGSVNPLYGFNKGPQ